MNRIKGFTLIELLVVIAIIGILATLVITQVAGAQVRARNSQAKSDVTAGGKAVELFRNDEANATGNALAVTADATLSGPTGTTAGGTFTGTLTIKDVFAGRQVYDGTPANNKYGASLVKTPSTAHIFTYETAPNAAGTIAATSYSLWTQVANGSGVTDNSFCITNGASINGATASSAPAGCSF